MLGKKKRARANKIKSTMGYKWKERAHLRDLMVLEEKKK
jgi:hypothetical protein